MKPDPDVFSPQAGTDGALLDDVHRRRQRAGTQQQRQVARFARRIAAGDLKAAAKLGLDGRRGNHFGLAFFYQQDGHAALDCVTRDLAHDARTLPVKLDRYHRSVILLIEGRRGIGEPLAGENHGFGKQQWLDSVTAPLEEQFGAEWNSAFERGIDFLRVVIA